MQQLVITGIHLIEQMKLTVSHYPIQSDMHVKLSWEIVGLEHMVAQLKAGDPLTMGLKAANLESEWGAKMVTELPDLFRMVQDFRAAYEQKKRTATES